MFSIDASMRSGQALGASLAHSAPSCCDSLADSSGASAGVPGGSGGGDSGGRQAGSWETTVSASASVSEAAGGGDLSRFQDSRRLRYLLHDLAHSILPPESRECACHHISTDSASVSYCSETGRARYRGVARCGNVWVCPLCAPVVAVKRAEQIEDVLRWAMVEGVSVLKLALTCAHSLGDPLSDLLDRQVKAIRSFKASRPVRRILASLAYHGSITSKEATWGPENGWHPHQHEYWFVSWPPGDAEALEKLRADLSAEWLKALSRHGLVGSPKYALYLGRMKEDEISGGAASGYLVKAGTAAGYLVKAGTAAGLELSGGALKQGRKSDKPHKAGHYSPMELLAVDASWSRALFLEFYHAFKGRKQLVFSKSILRIYGDLIGTAPGEDGEIVEKEEPLKPSEVTVLVLGHGYLAALRQAREAVRVLELVEAGRVQDAADLVESVYAAWVDRRYRWAVEHVRGRYRALGVSDIWRAAA